VFEMFKKIDRNRRLTLFFKVTKTVHERALFYALVTFAAKVFDTNVDDVSTWYLKVLKSKERVIKRNFVLALNNYSKAGDQLEIDMKVLRFIFDLGQVNF